MQKIETYITNIKYMNGPNIYALFPVMEATIDIKGWKDEPLDEDFADRLLSVIPSLKNHTCSFGKVGGFEIKIREGTYPEHVIEHCCIEIQNIIGSSVAFGRSKKIDNGLYKLAIEYEYKKVAEIALKGAVDLVNSLLNGKDKKQVRNILQDAIESGKKWFFREKLGPSTSAIIEAAKRRDIPVKRILNDASLFYLGYGKYRKKIWGPITSNTTLIGSDISRDEDITKKILYKSGFPVPKGYICSSLEEAINIADKIGFPLVIKPCSGHHSDGVLGPLRSEEDLEKAYNISSKYSNRLLVEEFVKGKDYRFLVVGNEVVAVAERIPAQVIGNGESDICELVEEVNKDPERGDGHGSNLTKIRLGEEEKIYLEIQDLNCGYIPKEGEIVNLRIGGNLTTGGTSKDVTEKVHPTLKEEMERISRILEMDVVGIDVVCEDITKSIDETKWWVIETNASPGLRMHENPDEGERKKVGEKIIDNLFSSNNGRIPIVSITGTNGKTTTARLIDWIARYAGFNTGLAVTGGIWIDRKRIQKGDTTGPWSAEVVLNDPNVEFAILETARGGIVRKGLGYDKSKVSVVTNIQEDHFGKDIKNLEDLFWIKSLVLEATQREGYSVINAQDKFYKGLLAKANGNPVIFSKKKDKKVEKEIENGEDVLFYEDGSIYFVEEGNINEIVGIDDISFLRKDVKFMIENTLAAIASTYSAGISYEDIIEGIKTFEMNEKMNPGRMNRYKFDSVNVVLDYAHNPSSFESMGKYVESLGDGRKIIVFTVPGDRTEGLIKKCGIVVGKNFDYIIITENPKIMRGKEKGEIANELTRFVSSVNNNVITIPERKTAIIHSLELLKEDDNLIIADLDVTFKELKKLISESDTILNLQTLEEE